MSDPQGDANEKPSGFMDRVRGWIGRHPIWSVVIAAVVFLIVGAAIGVAATQDETSDDSDQNQVSELEGEASDPAQDSELEGELSDLEDQLASSEEQVAALEKKLTKTQRRLDRQREKQEAQPEVDQQQEEQEAEPEPPATNGDSGDEDGGDEGSEFTVGEFTFRDVQVRDDGLGNFEVLARVTNNGEAVDFADMKATVFNEGSVVAVGLAVEPFDADQTRTVRFISTDDFGPWDDVEFTVDT